MINKKTVILVPSSRGILSVYGELAREVAKTFEPHPEVRSQINPVLKHKREIGKIVVLVGAGRKNADQTFKALIDGGFNKSLIIVLDSWDWKISGQVKLNPKKLFNQLVQCCGHFRAL